MRLLMLLAFLPFSVSAQEAAPALASYTLSDTDAAEAVQEALIEKGAGERVQAIPMGFRERTLYSSDKPLSIEVKGLQYDASTYRWTANLLFTSGGEVLSAMPASGRYQEMTLLPVLKRPMKYGETVAESDIDYREFPAMRMRADIVSEPKDMVGLSPRRLVSPGRPVRTLELATPAVMKKSAMVQMTYRTPAMEIAVAGQALDAGAKGDVITVRNLTSKQVVRAVILDEKTVNVAPLVQSSALLGDSHVN